MSGVVISGAQTGDLLRTHDWGATPLGAMENWPQSLRTAVDMMMASGHAMCLAWGPDRTFLYNDAYIAMLGNRHPASFGATFSEAWPDVWEEIEPLVDRTFSGETVTFQDMPLTMTRFGYPEETNWTFSYSPVRDEAGDVAGLLNVTLETTEVRAAREQQRMLNLELSHRLKNTLGVVQAIAHQTFGVLGRSEVGEAFTARLQALALASDFLTQHNWSATRLDELATTVLNSFGDRIDASGPQVALGPNATLTISLLLHELATNATKHGALSAREGRVALKWSIATAREEPSLVLRWDEQGGPAASEPTRRGFGSRLLAMGLGSGAQSDLVYGQGGFRATFTASLRKLEAD